MNRSDFIEILCRELKSLPQEEIDAAVEYYEEYFDEAGADREEQVIEELGNPKKIAGQIKSEYAVRKLDEEEGSTARKGFSAVRWMIIGICSAPLSIPVSIVMVTLAVCGFVLALAVLIAVFCGVLAMIVTAVVMIVVGIMAIPVTVSSAVLLIGVGLLGLALFAAIGVLAAILTQKIVSSMVSWLRRKNEERKLNRIEGRNKG